MKIEDPKQHHFTPEEAEAFMSTWFRLVASDGSTYAYVPDRATAEVIIGLFEEYAREHVGEIREWLRGRREEPHG